MWITRIDLIVWRYGRMQSCAENNRFIGSVSVDRNVTKLVSIPTADHPDF